ncbi:hypothetical protein PsorP6_006807 [Peronosclerospora sorghi]|uniref:Uncharacterized protein n=1 Tax=Peronosclerospora sorghi TaxID=230839 RepID=A0ACC0W7B1_9STRA|nr:hypothetical protein PsorP6_006807 [Peronosclerospora sorghi]
MNPHPLTSKQTHFKQDAGITALPSRDQNRSAESEVKTEDGIYKRRGGQFIDHIEKCSPTNAHISRARLVIYTTQ